jgi:ADP-ribose pyrophosphatase YjhB (NUDIX family)
MNGGFKEYDIGNITPDMKTGYLSDDVFRTVREFSADINVDVCAIAHNEYGKKGILLVERVQEPAKGLLWTIGGQVKRGERIEDSVRSKVEQECGLVVDEMEYINLARIFFEANSFEDSNKGTDAFSLRYLAHCFGEVALDETSGSYKIVTPADYDSLRESLHPFVRDPMDLVMLQLRL